MWRFSSVATTVGLTPPLLSAPRWRPLSIAVYTAKQFDGKYVFTVFLEGATAVADAMCNRCSPFLKFSHSLGLDRSCHVSRPIQLWKIPAPPPQWLSYTSHGHLLTVTWRHAQSKRKCCASSYGCQLRLIIMVERPPLRINPRARAGLP